MARELNVTDACATGSSMNAWLASAWATVSRGTMPSALADQLVGFTPSSGATGS